MNICFRESICVLYSIIPSQGVTFLRSRLRTGVLVSVLLLRWDIKKDNLSYKKREEFNWGFAYNIRGLVHYHHAKTRTVWSYSSNWEFCILICKQQAERETLGTGVYFWNPKAHPFVIYLFQLRPYLLILPNSPWTGNQGFKYMILRGPFLPKPTQMWRVSPWRVLPMN